MLWKDLNRQTRLYLVSAAVLLAGLCSAVLIYLTAADSSDGITDNAPEYSKMYTHDLELYGGKANVLAAEFTHWFAGLWHGQTLAFTVACITVLISLGLCFVAYHLYPDLETDVRSEENMDKHV
ncbi:MAG TPA: hypothetical protein VFG19_10020 [Geobacteraceae bacterium]|nr:hypothetical protein [Geobacteraceae bacterium]